MKYLLLCIASMFLVNLSHSDGGATEKLSPKMKQIDRSEAFFSSIPCEKTGEVKVYSKLEEQRLNQRKEQCLKKYRVFLPNPANR